MKELNFINEFAKSRASDENSSFLLNMYLESDASGGKYSNIALPFPGATAISTNSGVVRGAITVAGIPYFVIGNTFYYMDSGNTLHSLGTLFTSSGAVQLASVTNEIMIIDGQNGYLYTVSSNTFSILAQNGSTTVSATTTNTNIISVTSITPFSTSYLAAIQMNNGSIYFSTISATGVSTITLPSNIPGTANAGNQIWCTALPVGNPVAVTSQDGFFLIAGQNSNIVFCSNANDGTTWNPLAFQGKGGSGDNVVALSTNKRYLYVIGQQTSEVWYNNGNNPMPFTSVGPGSFFYLGSPAPYSVAITGATIRKERGTVDPGQSFLDQEAIVFLSQSANGGLTIVLLDQYKPVQIANRAIANVISTFSTVSDAIGYCCEFLSHSFYVITFPTANRTFAFDFTTGTWLELQSYVSGSYQRHLGNCFCAAYGKDFIGDWNSGNIYYLDTTDYQDNGNTQKRQLTTPPGYFKGNKGFLDKLQIDLQTNVGSNLAVTLEISYDSGQTFTTVGTQNIPAAGGRMYWTRLGMTQNAIVVRITFTSNAFFAVLGALANIRQGIH